MKSLLVFLILIPLSCFAGCGEDVLALEKEYARGFSNRSVSELSAILDCELVEPAAYAALILSDKGKYSEDIERVLVASVNESPGFWLSRAAVEEICSTYKGSCGGVILDFLYENLISRRGDERVSVLGGYLSFKLKDPRVVDYIDKHYDGFSSDEKIIAKAVLEYMKGNVVLIHD